MTRFARARGSKSSNKREPEEATSWKQMKESLLNNSSNENSATEKQNEILKCKETLNSLKKDSSISWSTFEESSEGKSKKKKTNIENRNTILNNPTKKKRKLKDDEEDSENTGSQKTFSNKDINNGDTKDPNKVKNENTTDESKKSKNKNKGNISVESNKNVKIKNNKKNKITSNSVMTSDSNNIDDNSQQNTKKSTSNKKNKKEFKTRKKPLPEPYQMDINGEMVDIITYDGFPIKKEDAVRLDELKKSLFAKGIPKCEIKKIMKLQRRSAEKALSRAKKRACFNCRKSGHNLSECPVLNTGERTGICFKCGSTEHTHFECKVVKKLEYKFAQCFICKEQGHISNQCPDNPRGLYPKGGACKLCGDVTHLKRFCPTLPKESDPTIDQFLDNEDSSKPNKRNSMNDTTKKQKHIMF